MEAVTQALGRSWKIDHCHRDNLGWDITATAQGKPELRIEVKGLSGMTPVVEVTPNEFGAMNAADHRGDDIRYVVAIVVEALSEKRRCVRAFAWRHGWVRFDLLSATFVKGSTERLFVKELTGARLQIIDGDI